MKLLWLLVSIVAVIAGTAAGEISRTTSYAWVNSSDASTQIIGGGGSEYHCQGDVCKVCFSPQAVPRLRATLCTSTPGAAVLQPFTASLVTASVLLAFWSLVRRRRRRDAEPTRTPD